MRRLVGALVVVASASLLINAAATAAQPDPAAITVTRGGGPLSGAGQGASQELWLDPGEADALPTRGLISTDRGQLLEVEIVENTDPAHGPAAGLVAATARVVEDPSPGTYSGQIALGPGKQIEIEVLVEDAIWWPVGAVALGALVGAWATRSWAWRRRRRQAKLALVAAVESYREQTKTPSSFGSAWDLNWPARDALPSKKTCDCDEPIVDPLAQLECLWCGVLAAKGEDEVSKLSGHVEQLTADFDRWLELNWELGRLAHAVDVLAEPDSAPVQEARRLAEIFRTRPASEEERQALLARSRRLTAVVSAYALAQTAWEALPTPEQQGHHDLNPATRYGDHAAEPQRTAQETAALLGDLSSARTELVKLIEAVQPTGLEVGLAAPTGGAIETRIANVINALTGVGPAPSAAALGRAAWRWDLAAQVVVALLSAAAYVLVEFPDHDFGQPQDYATAALAGLLGQVAGFAIVGRPIADKA